MGNWKKTLITPESTILEAIKTIDAGALQIALVVDERKRLLGTVTDGDVRRGLLRGISLTEPVQTVMCSSPTVARNNESRESILTLMKEKSLRHIPILDQDGQIVGMEILGEFLSPAVRQNRVVLMAGGLGTRLRPLTNDIPKPLLRIGDKPILEIVLESLIKHGFRKFHISTHFKAEMIEGYFGDGSRWGVDIKYLREARKLGTAGPLGLLQEIPPHPLLVMNGDLITQVNFGQLLYFHSEHQVQATMCVRQYDFEVPYGVVKIENQRLAGIDEKPVHRFFVNAGIYVLEPHVLSLIQADTPMDMPDLFKKILEQGGKVVPFPVRESWLDIGRLDDFERAEAEFRNTER